jgi:hypothetical protein
MINYQISEVLDVGSVRNAMCVRTKKRPHDRFVCCAHTSFRPQAALFVCFYFLLNK